MSTAAIPPAADPEARDSTAAIWGKRFLIFFALLMSTAFTQGLLAGNLSISIDEWSPEGGLETIAFFRADDEAARGEVLELWNEAKNVFPRNRRNLFGPDSGFVSITIRNRMRKIVVRSWHPLFEKGTGAVVTSRGVEALNGRDRDEILRADEAWYREARAAFDRIVAFTKAKATEGAAR